MKENFEKIWAPFAAMVGAVLLALQLGMAFAGNRTLVTGLLILVSLIAIAAGTWNYAFAASSVPGFPRYRFHWAAKLVFVLSGFAILAAANYILAILNVLPDCCGFLPAVSSTPSATPAVTPTTTPEYFLSPAIRTVDQYFRHINLAEEAAELSSAWDLMTIKLRCNVTDKCSFENFRNWWWTQQVQYRLYDCGPSTVDAEVIYYGRNTSPGPWNNLTYIEYDLVEENGKLKLDSGDIVSGVGANCRLALSVP